MLLVYGVHVTNSAKEELFQPLVCLLLLSQYLRALSVKSRGSCDLDGSADACSVMTWVGRDDKGDG